MESPYTPLLYSPSRREPTSTRLSTTFLSGILLFVVLNCLLTAEAILSTYQTQSASDTPLAALTTDHDNLLKCASWRPNPNNTHPHASWESVEFDLPIDAKSLFVVSRGSLSSGIVRVHQSSHVKDLKVGVTAHYHKKEALSRARVCLVDRENVGKGVAILTPIRWFPPKRKDKVHFVVDVTFPSPSQGIRHLSSFTLAFPRFVLDVDHLSGYSFPVPPIVGHRETIIAESKNGKIEGTFNVTKLLKVFTTNSPINVSLNAHSNLPRRPTVVFLKSTNGLLHSNISLSTNSSSGTGGFFRVHADTSNAALSVSFPSGPPESRLVFDGSTKNAPARVALDPAFEGGFLLQTTKFHPTVHLTPGVEDPTGRGRKRKLNDRVVGGRAVIGNVSWVSPGNHPQARPEGASWASVSSRNAPVTLVF
ncbi:hypothetical protein BJV77DRAFT_1067875 [Russula vinacea]|nr:hypothetical protein BJV77DRAFT_1067875 [Russula vinacea]